MLRVVIVQALYNTQSQMDAVLVSSSGSIMSASAKNLQLTFEAVC